MIPARLLRFWLPVGLAVSLLSQHAKGSLIFLYDFPADSGLASDQSNQQPSGATFGDWIRDTVQQVPNAGNTFGSNNWSLSGSLDANVFESFSISADVGLHLNLSSLTFTAYRSATGPQNMEVALFLNGSTSAYATLDFSPTTSTASYAFNFTPLTDADNVTTATFKFFGWNGQGVGGQLYLDDVASYGLISSVPEPATIWPMIVVIGCALGSTRSELRASCGAALLRLRRKNFV
jgi:hypothetical protein